MVGSSVQVLTRSSSEFLQAYFPFWTFWAIIYFHVHSGNELNSIPFGSKTEVPFSLLTVSWGSLSRPCRKRRPSSRDVGGVSWFFWSCGASVGFLTRYDRELREPLVWCQGSQVSIRVARGRTSLLSSHGSGIRAQRNEKGRSRSFSGCGRKPWVPSTCACDLR